MTTRLGMDPDEVRRLGTTLGDGADTLAGIRAAVTRRLDETTWHGPDAQRMRGTWNSSVVPTLTQAATALRAAARKAGENADAQERASGSGGMSAFVGAGSGSGGGAAAFFGAGSSSGGGAAAFFGAGSGSGGGTGAGGDADAPGNKIKGWLVDRGTGVVGWFGDRADDVAGIVDATRYALSKDGRDMLHSILARGNDNPIMDDWMNVMDSHLQVWDSYLTGEAPRTTEVLGSGFRSLGSVIGALLTTGTLGAWEANFFDDGYATVSAPVPVPQGEITAPKDLTAVMDLMEPAYKAGDGSIRVLTIDGTDPPKAVVAIPGTQTWNPFASSNPADLTADLVEVGGGRATWTEGVELALREAGLQPDTEVMLVGHSLGGSTATGLASDPGFVTEFNVTNVITYGSPIDTDEVVPGVDVLQMEHGFDAVPKLDLGDSRVDPKQFGPQAPTYPKVELPSPSGPLSLQENHAYLRYRDSVEASDNPTLRAHENRLRDEGWFTEDRSKVRVTSIQITRED